MLNRKRRYLCYLAMVVVITWLLLGHLWTHLELERYQNTRFSATDHHHNVPSAANIRAFSLNHETAGADILWLGMLFYASDRRAERLPRSAVTDYADSIVELDPHNAPTYHWHNAFRFGTSISPDDHDLQEANRLLAEGLEYFPEQWQFARSIAINNHSARHRLHRPPSKRLEDLEQAVHYARKGAEIEDAPPEMTGLALSLRDRLDRLRHHVEDSPQTAYDDTGISETELNFLFRRYFTADSEQQRNQIRAHLFELGVEEALVEELSNHQHRLSENHRERYAYLPPDAYLMVDTGLYRWHDSGEFTMYSPELPHDE